MKVLFLDDSIDRVKKFKQLVINHSITHVVTAEEAIKSLDKEAFDVIMLDHDLAEEHYNNPNHNLKGTGKDVAIHLAKNAEKFEDALILVHSLNEPGSVRMIGIMEQAGLNATREPFIWMSEQRLRGYGLLPPLESETGKD